MQNSLKIWFVTHFLLLVCKEISTDILITHTTLAMSNVSRLLWLFPLSLHYACSDYIYGNAILCLLNLIIQKIEAHIVYIYTQLHNVFYVYFLSNSSVLHFIKVSVYDRLGEKKKKLVLYHGLFEKYCPRILWILWPFLHVTYFLF